MKQLLLFVVFFALCFSSKSQTEDDKTLTLGDPLLIVLINTPIKSFINFKSEISYSYQGLYTIANYYEVMQNPVKFEDYRHVLSVTVIRTNSTEGKYTGIYFLKDEVNKSEVKWVFHSDDKLPNTRALFSMLSQAASDPKTGYNDVFEDYQEFDSNKPPEVKLNTHSASITSIPESLNATFLINSETGQGSGFFIDSKYAITNYHVVGSKKVAVGIDNAGNEFAINVVEIDPENDLALLKADDDYVSSYYFNFSEPLDSNLVGREVFAIGSPASEELINTVSGGIVSGIRTFDDQEIIQISAPVNPGNSGGPLIDSQGVLLGIVVAKIAGLSTEGIAFAISKEQILKSFNLTPQ